MWVECRSLRIKWAIVCTPCPSWTFQILGFFPETTDLTKLEGSKCSMFCSIFQQRWATLGSDWLTHCDFPSDTASWIFTKLDRKQAPDSFLRRLSFYPSTIVATLVFDLSTYHIMAVFSPTFLYISMTLNTRHKARHRRPLQRTSFSGQSINKAGHLRLWMTDTVSSPVNNCLDLNKTGMEWKLQMHTSMFSRARFSTSLTSCTTLDVSVQNKCTLGHLVSDNRQIDL